MNLTVPFTFISLVDSKSASLIEMVILEACESSSDGELNFEETSGSNFLNEESLNFSQLTVLNVDVFGLIEVELHFIVNVIGRWSVRGENNRSNLVVFSARLELAIARSIIELESL